MRSVYSSIFIIIIIIIISSSIFVISFKLFLLREKKNTIFFELKITLFSNFRPMAENLKIEYFLIHSILLLYLCVERLSISSVSLLKTRAFDSLKHNITYIDY